MTGNIVNADISGGAAIGIAKLAGYPSDSSKVLQGDGTWGAKPTAATTYRKNTSKTVNTTTSATDLLNGEITVTGGAISSTGVLRLTASGDHKQNSGGTTDSFKWQLYLGSTLLVDSGTIGNASTWPNSATRRGWRVVCEITNLNATNSQSAWLQMITGCTTSVDNTADIATGEGTYSANKGLLIAQGFNTAAVDTTVNQALVLKITNPSNSANCETKLYMALVEII